ncbi:CapA family protein [Planosporangium sp. 12N6]|uniref:CapA family protein n=1 Tax=Planosporangium spinosum TaxID=3402278 RepID=UPI003CF38497
MTRSRTRTTVLVAAALVAVLAALGVRAVLGRSAAPHGPRAATRPTPPAGTSPAPRTLTVLGAGDVLLHPPLWEQAAADARAQGRSGYDFAPVFADVKPDVSAADLAVCHLETPVGAPGGPFSGYPAFNVPPQVTAAIKDAGFDTCSTASNHTLDAGAEGVFRTVDALDAAGLRHAGSYRDAAAQQTPNIVPVHGVGVAQLSYTFGFNGLDRPAGQEWIANLIDPEAIIAEARRARAAGAQIVVVSLHWGTEYQVDADADQQRWARQLLAAPEIDLILGCHAHVVQPFEQIDGEWVAYGMGNEVARHEDPIDASREGVMPRFTFTEATPGHWRVTRAEALPTWVELTPKIHIVELARVLADPATPAPQRAVYQAAYDRISRSLRSRGADVAGLAVAPVSAPGSTGPR